MLTIKQAAPEELDDVIQFYWDLIDAMQDVEFKPARILIYMNWFYEQHRLANKG